MCQSIHLLSSIIFLILYPPPSVGGGGQQPHPHPQGQESIKDNKVNNLTSSVVINNAGSISVINEYRKWHGVPPLEYDVVLGQNAAKWGTKVHDKVVLQGKLIPLYSHPHIEGENIFVAQGSPPSSLAVYTWYQEIRKFNFTLNTFSFQTAQFTQLVWKRTKRLGMATLYDPLRNFTVIVARFKPPGNVGFQSSFRENIFPPHQISGVGVTSPKPQTSHIKGLSSTTTSTTPPPTTPTTIRSSSSTTKTSRIVHIAPTKSPVTTPTTTPATLLQSPPKVPQALKPLRNESNKVVQQDKGAVNTLLPLTLLQFLKELTQAVSDKASNHLAINTTLTSTTTSRTPTPTTITTPNSILLRESSNNNGTSAGKLRHPPYARISPNNITPSPPPNMMRQPSPKSLVPPNLGISLNHTNISSSSSAEQRNHAYSSSIPTIL